MVENNKAIGCLSSLTALFQECIEKQRTQPMYEWGVVVSDPVDGFDEFAQWFFFGEVGRVLTNRPSIGFGFKFNDDQYSRFIQLDISKEFEEDRDDVEADHCYSIKCGEDASKAASLVYEVLTEVYQLTNLPTFILQHNSICWDKNSLKSYFHNHLPMMFCFDLPNCADMGKIAKQYERVASCMSKYNFGHIEINNDKRCVKGYYQPTEEPKGFLASVKYGGQLGDTEGELIRLLELCYQSFK